jgi:hypothetical protein
MRGAAFGAEFSAARRKRCVCLLEGSPIGKDNPERTSPPCSGRDSSRVGINSFKDYVDPTFQAHLAMHQHWTWEPYGGRGTTHSSEHLRPRHQLSAFSHLGH